MRSSFKTHSYRIVILLIAASIISFGAFLFSSYSNNINSQLFDASSQSLEETYSEVILVFDELTRSRWNYLEQIGLFLKYNEHNQDTLDDYIEYLRQLHDFTDFYLLDDRGGYITVDGSTGYIDFGDSLFRLIDNGDNIITDGSLPGRENMFFYAVATEPGEYQGFSYCAVAFGYNKEALANVLTVDVYDGESDVYLVYPNGRVCITMGDVSYEIRNVLSTLAEYDIPEDIQETVANDLNDGTTDTVKVSFDGKDYYISYLSTELSDWRFLSITPVSAVDKNLNEVRSDTTGMMTALFGAIVLLLIAVFLYWAWHTNRNKKSLLAERELIFGVLSEHMNEIYFLYYEEGDRILYISPNVERMLGLTPPEIYTNKRVLNKCVSDRNAWDNKSYLAKIEPGQSIHREYDMTNPITKETHPYLLDLYRPEGRFHTTLVGSLTDNSQEHAVRQNIIEAMESARAANEAKSAFLSNMSHDIRTPMNAIIGFSTLLERDADDPELVRQHVAKIQASGNHLLGLINDILDMSKIESGSAVLENQPVQIHEIATSITELLRPLAEAKQQELVLQLDCPEEESVLADRLRLMQILQNLLSNAVKYTPNGGKIEFYVIRSQEDQRESFHSYLFVVKDNGIGMSEEFQAHIFDPFTRETKSTVNKIQGTGLGMSITKSLVDLMGGTIRVTSETGKGSVFEVMIEFRAAKEHAEDAKGGAPTDDTSNTGSAIVDTRNVTGSIETNDDEKDAKKASAFSLEGLHILAAEDNEINAEILVELLKMEGITCDLAANGQDAVERFEEEAKNATHYDLILMDVQMPVMDGYEATRRIRKSEKNPRGASIPILAMTANAFGEDIQNALDAGMNAHLAKPLDMRKLCDIIEDILTTPEKSERRGEPRSSFLT